MLPKKYSINLPSSLSPINLHRLSGWLFIREGQIMSFKTLLGTDFELTLISEVKKWHYSPPVSTELLQAHFIVDAVGPNPML